MLWQAILLLAGSVAAMPLGPFDTIPMRKFMSIVQMEASEQDVHLPQIYVLAVSLTSITVLGAFFLCTDIHRRFLNSVRTIFNAQQPIADVAEEEQPLNQPAVASPDDVEAALPPCTCGASPERAGPSRFEVTPVVEEPPPAPVDQEFLLSMTRFVPLVPVDEAGRPLSKVYRLIPSSDVERAAGTSAGLATAWGLGIVAEPFARAQEQSTDSRLDVVLLAKKPTYINFDVYNQPGPSGLQRNIERYTLDKPKVEKRKVEKPKVQKPETPKKDASTDPIWVLRPEFQRAHDEAEAAAALTRSAPSVSVFDEMTDRHFNVPIAPPAPKKPQVKMSLSLQVIDEVKGAEESHAQEAAQARPDEADAPAQDEQDDVHNHSDDSTISIPAWHFEEPAEYVPEVAPAAEVVNVMAALVPEDSPIDPQQSPNPREGIPDHPPTPPKGSEASRRF